MGSFSNQICRFMACCGLFLAGIAYAEEERMVTVSAPSRFSGQVARAFLVLSDSERVLAVAPAHYVEQSEERGSAVVGRLPVPQIETPLQMLFIITGSKGEVWSTYREIHFGELSATAGLKTGELRSRFVERRGVWRALQSSLAAQEARIDDLEADADAIANVTRIVSAEDELQEVKGSIARVAAAQEGIRERIERMKSRKEPPNAQKREADLVEQLREISTALSVTEASSIQKVAAATTDLQQKISLIEETRDEHIDELERELAELRRKRQRPEQR